MSTFEITSRGGVMINRPSAAKANDIGIFHTEQESVAPPVSFISASGITITGSALSAYSPPRALYINPPSPGTVYKVYPFPSNIPGAVEYVFVNHYFSGYLQGAFNRVLTESGSELPAASSVYFV